MSTTIPFTSNQHTGRGIFRSWMARQMASGKMARQTAVKANRLRVQSRSRNYYSVIDTHLYTHLPFLWKTQESWSNYICRMGNSWSSLQPFSDRKSQNRRNWWILWMYTKYKGNAASSGIWTEFAVLITNTPTLHVLTEVNFGKALSKELIYGLSLTVQSL